MIKNIAEIHCVSENIRKVFPLLFPISFKTLSKLSETHTNGYDKHIYKYSVATRELSW